MFKGGNRNIRKKLNKIARNSSRVARQHGNLFSQRTLMGGIVQSLSPKKIQTRIPMSAQTSGGTTIRKAYAISAAGNSETIDCYLDTDSSDSSTITVHCEIVGTQQRLDSATPLLDNGSMICVWYDSADSVWRAIQTFENTTEDCP